MYLGIDIHKRYAQVAVLDENGELVEEVRVENANLDEIGQKYAGSEAAIEATSNYYHIHDTLSEYLDVSVANPAVVESTHEIRNRGSRPHDVNPSRTGRRSTGSLPNLAPFSTTDPARVKLIADSDQKTDRVDAKELARLVRLGSIPESYVPPDEIRECRALVRGRHKLVENRKDYTNKIHGLLTEHGITRKVKPLTVEGREFLEKLSLPAPWDMLLETYLEMIETFTVQIEQLEAVIEDRAASLEETQLLMTIPGVSYYSALLIYAEIGEIDRFDEAKQVVSYAGLNPVIRESGDSRFEGGISKRGSGKLRWILVQCSNVAVHTSGDEYLSRFYNRLEGRKSPKEAIVATARKLLVSIFHMLDRKEVYDPPGVST